MANVLKEILGKQWSLDFLRLLHRRGELNFGTIQEELGISSSTLTDTKDCLLDHDLIVKNEVHRQNIQYDISGKGEDFLRHAEKLIDVLES